MLALSSPSAAPRADAKDTVDDETPSKRALKQDIAKCIASAQAVVEPYERYKSVELRAECYRRGTRPIRTGARANDNKAGYLSLLRTYDRANASGVAPVDHEQSLDLRESLKASQRALSSDAPRSVESQDGDVKRRRTRGRAYVPSEPSGNSETVQPFLRSAPEAASAHARDPEEKQLAVEYMRLKMKLLRETHAMEKARRRDDKHLKLHTELQGVVTTLAQLHRVAKEYALEQNAGLLGEAKQDIAFFQTRKRQIQRELLVDEEQDQKDKCS